MYPEPKKLLPVRTGLVAKSITSPEMFRYSMSCSRTCALLAVHAHCWQLWLQRVFETSVIALIQTSIIQSSHGQWHQFLETPMSWPSSRLCPCTDSVQLVLQRPASYTWPKIHLRWRHMSHHSRPIRQRIGMQSLVRYGVDVTLLSTVAT